MSNAFVVRMTITLDDVTPAVSRVIEVPLTIRLDRLHAVFQAALAWTDSHLWELTFGRTGFGIPDPSYGFDGPLDARKATLAEALEGMRGKTFRYLYDFGDGWEHSVRIEGIVPADLQASYPRLLEATGMRPPEDSGGPWGYAETLQALADPTHEYHEDALEALGDDHDPHAQPDIDLIHARFAALAEKIGAATAKDEIGPTSTPPSVGAYRRRAGSSLSLASLCRSESQRTAGRGASDGPLSQGRRPIWHCRFDGGLDGGSHRLRRHENRPAPS